MAHLEILAEIDSLVGQLRRWAKNAPDWPPADACRAIIGRLVERTEALRVRVEAPLVVATLGGTGTGKSSLLNALAGDEVVRAGRERPTTTRPTLICRPDVSPEMLGIDPASVDRVARDLPSLANLVLLDCPDPDTTEQPDAGETNLTRLRHLLPHCDVLLV
ncbi:MAG: GTPase domain-containing protein, partial [Pirellulales bacterium]|nr:GTPase domain-containing protein [Pirellulales bacterium]